MKISYRRIGLVIGGIIIGYLLMIQLIYLAAPNQPRETFPEDCKSTSNCTRVAETNVRGERLEPLHFSTSIETVHDEIIQWIENQPRTEILTDTNQFIHSAFTTLFFRFNDDFYTSIFCEEDEVVVYTQSESRLGQGDLGVNEDRVRDFYVYMQNQSFETLPC